jgi:hypothetical protein
MAIDLVLLTTLIVSIGDLVVNLGALCCKGRIKMNCSDCFTVEHNENDGLTKSEVMDAVHRASHKHESPPIASTDKLEPPTILVTHEK